VHQCARRRRKRLYLPSEQIDQLIREGYRRFWEFNSRKAIKATASRIGWPAWAVKKRARVLGLCRASEAQPWTEQEEQLLQQWSHHCDDVIVRKMRERGIHRTATAVHLKIKRLRIRTNRDWYSATSLAEAFGVDQHKITGWIRRGLLHAERRGTERTEAQGGDSWYILHSAVRDFVFKCPDEVDLKKVEKFWFLDLITDGRICR
jgi:hypothetical protein